MRIFARLFLLALVLVLAVGGIAQQTARQSETAIRGWLSDGTFTATNPECAKECVAKGKKIVLIDLDLKMIFEIANQSLAKRNIGDYVEICLLYTSPSPR